MTTPRDKQPSAEVQALASRAMRHPESLSLEEIRTLGASLVSQSDGTPPRQRPAAGAG